MLIAILMMESHMPRQPQGDLSCIWRHKEDGFQFGSSGQYVLDGSKNSNWLKGTLLFVKGTKQVINKSTHA